MSTITLASAASVKYLCDLFVERLGVELPAVEYEGLTQAQVSGKINRVLSEPGRVPAPVEKQDRVIELGKALGMTIVPGATLDVVNRQIRDLEKKTRRAEYKRGASDFDAFLKTLAPAEAEDDATVPF